MVKKKAAKKTSVRRDVERWETLTASALPPGYVNVYMMPKGETLFTPCAALLTQSLVALEVWQDVKDKEPKLVSSKLAKPKTRVVYGDSDDDMKRLEAVMPNARYAGTVYAPEKFAEVTRRQFDGILQWIADERLKQEPTPGEPTQLPA